MADAVNEVEVPAQQLLVQPGTAGTGMFFIAEGIAVVETRRDEIELGPGQFFGELALISEDSTRTARVRAKTELRCLALDRASFRTLVSEHPAGKIRHHPECLSAAITALAQGKLGAWRSRADTP